MMHYSSETFQISLLLSYEWNVVNRLNKIAQKAMILLN
jgi:hypothetical protein